MFLRNFVNRNNKIKKLQSHRGRLKKELAQTEKEIEQLCGESIASVFEKF